MRKVLVALGLLLLLPAAIIAWLAADLNRFRPLIEERFAAQTGEAISIGGDLGWELLPSPALIGADVQSADGAWRVAELRFHPVGGRFGLRGLRVQTAILEGLCGLEFSFAETAAQPASPHGQGQLVPAALLSGVQGEGGCAWLRFVDADQSVGQVKANFTANNGRLSLDLQAPRVLGGAGQAQIDLNFLAEPVAWTVDLKVDGLQGAALEPWLGPQASWRAQADVVGAFQLAGNTTVELASSISGNISLQAGEGEMQAPALNRLLASAARLSGIAAAAPPSRLRHQSLVGEWKVQGADQQLRIEMDNLVVEAKGQHHFLPDILDLAATVTLNDDPTLPQLAPNPILVDLPIPLRCKGTLAQPNCALDGPAAGRLLKDLLQGGQGSPQRERLNAVIDGWVPAEHQEAARALLQLLRRGVGEDRP